MRSKTILIVLHSIRETVLFEPFPGFYIDNEKNYKKERYLDIFCFDDVIQCHDIVIKERNSAVDQGVQGHTQGPDISSLKQTWFTNFNILAF